MPYVWNSNTLATWCEELTHLKRPWCWERLKAGGEADDRGGDGWMASSTQWTWVWACSRSWWWIGRPGILQSMGLQRVGQDWATELNWTPVYHTCLQISQLAYGFQPQHMSLTGPNSVQADTMATSLAGSYLKMKFICPLIFTPQILNLQKGLKIAQWTSYTPLPSVASSWPFVTFPFFFIYSWIFFLNYLIAIFWCHGTLPPNI